MSSPSKEPLSSQHARTSTNDKEAEASKLCQDVQIEPKSFPAQIEKHIAELTRAPLHDEPRVSQICEPPHPSHGTQSGTNCSTTQIEPRVEEFIRARANENEREAGAAKTSQPSGSNGSTTQIEPRVEEFIRARANEQKAGAAEINESSHDTGSESNGSTTQIEPRVAEFIRQLANEDSDVLAEDITTILTKAAPAAPNARLILHSDYTDGHDMSRHATSLSEKIRGREVFAVAQTIHDVFFPVRFLTPVEFMCRIVYDPGSDDCLFVNLSPENVQISRVNPPNSLFVVENNHGQLIQPGIWRIMASRGLDNYSLVEFLLLERSFSVMIHEAKISLVKRATDADSRKPPKRQRFDNNVPEETIVTQSTDSLITKSGPTDTDIGSPREIANKAAVPLLDLADREIAVIQAPHAPDSATYRLQRIKQLGMTGSTLVFSCRHSGIPRRRLVVEVLRYNGSSALTLPLFAKLWITEKSMLQKAKHRNIVALEAFDGRMLVMYLELLPLSLNRGTQSPFKQADAYTILLNISSALAYLATRGIVHNDIKPANIAYNPQRGAVLFDFGMACKINDNARGGTPWYIPPDWIDNGNHGVPGDIWAMGVTMLYVLQKIKMPERMTRGWNLRDLAPPVQTESSAFVQMSDWLDIVAEKRAELNQKDLVENAVFRMLDRDSALRAVAGEIEEALKVTLEAS